MLQQLTTWLLLLFSASCCIVAAVHEAEKNNTVPVSIGVIYDEHEDNSIGKVGLNCIQMALSDFYSTHAHYKTRIVLHKKSYPLDSVVGAAAAALNLLKYAEVKAIIGPTTSMEAEFVIQLGEKAQVPIISYSATSPFLSPTRSSYFIRAAQNDSLQAQCIGALVQNFGWRQVVLIYEDNNFGAGLLPYLADALQQIDVRIPYRWALPSTFSDDEIREELYKLQTMQTRVFIVHMSYELAARLFMRVKELEMMDEGYVWITSTATSNEIGSLDGAVINSMQGVLGVRTYVPETKELKIFNTRWDRNYQGTKVSVIGLWAYDAAYALARAVEEVGILKSGVESQKVPANLTDLDTINVSPVGPKLLQAVLSASFKGLAGDFRLIDGQLESSTYQIVNVIGSSSRDVGFWTPQKGLVRNLNSSRGTSLRTIIWPGETALCPKGWEVPAGGKKLRVGVPVKYAYQELVKVTYNGSGEAPNVTGFCIDVFDAVMGSLPYSVSYQYFPFAKPDGTPAGSYDDLVMQVSHEKYDVVVGDVTIIAKRSSYVDFTLPFTESGVIMVVPVRYAKPRSAWIFLKPLTWELWVASLCAFIFIAFVIWILEHRINEDFRGPLSHQAGTSLFCSFSMMVFAQRENVLSNLARFVVIIWVFVVLVLTQSYTASLTSMLTVQQLQPTVTDVNEIIRTRASVGCQAGTFVKDLLVKIGFSESKLVPYNTLANLDDLLSRGSIAAVFDEIPYMRLFLAKYSSKYTMVQPTYKTDGFGFAFPKGSPLVPDVSRAILSVTEGDRMKEIENAWGMSQDMSSAETLPDSERSLGFESFRGLFIIAGVASAFALCIFAVTFLKEHRHIWMGSDASLGTKIQALARAFDQRDMASHTFKKNGVQRTLSFKTDQEASVGGVGSVELVPNIASPPRPSAGSDEADDDLAFSGE